ncbi:MAG: hypothetical protein P4N24_14740, partial [Acidobacteriota bacterium]|nr:hypothetical protein [Acidobacteriota bacterium]
MTPRSPQLAKNGLNYPHRFGPPQGWFAAILCIGFFSLSFAFLTPAQTTEPKRVLILLQEDLSWPLYQTIDENARATLRGGLPGGALIFSEHMDRIHFPDPMSQAQKRSWIQRKYANFNLDLVIAVGDVPT